MLDISKPLTSGKVRSYYREQYSAASNNYYSHTGELPGRWHGALVPVLGLEGTAVTAEAFDRLAEGQHPKTGEQLIRHRTPAKDQPSAGWQKNAEAWRAHLEDKYGAAIVDARQLFSGANALPEPEAVHRELAGLSRREYTDRQKKLIEMHTIAAGIFRENLESAGSESARKYLVERGIDHALSGEFGLGLATGRTKQIYKALEHFGPDLLEASGLFYKTASGMLLDRFQDRIMIPIQDAEGNVIAFAGRSIHENANNPKYLNSPATELYKKSEVLFNAHRAAGRVGEEIRVVAVEGYLDAIAAHKAGVPAVAIGSATVTEGQARQLGAMAQTVVLNLDSDEAGKAGTRRSLDVLMAQGIQGRVADIHPNLGKDPDQMVNKDQNGAELYRGMVSLLSKSGIEWVSDQWQEKLEKMDSEREDHAHIQIDGMRDVIALLEKAPEHLRADLSKRLSAFLGEQISEAKDEKKTTQLEHRAGWDLTFNAPKTVSVTALVGGDERVREAHQFAVKKALDVTQRYAQARMGGSRPAENTEKWIAALFDHDTARPVDGYPAPHLHTHSLVFNMTEDDAGQARSLQPYEIFKVQSLATAVYQNELAYRLRNLGYEITRGTNNAPDIKGYTPEYLAHESLRHNEIKGEVERRGVNGREAESLITHQDREPKIRYTPDELRALHRRHSEEHGSQAEKVVAQALGRVRWIENESDVPERATKAVNYARERLSERNSVFDGFELLRDALHHARGRARLERVEAEIQRQWDEGRFTKVEHVRRLAPGQRFTTPEAIAAERGMIEQVLVSAGAVKPLPIQKDTIRERYSNLNDDQKWLVYRALTGSEQILGVQGSAGTGKTTVLRAVRALAEANGYRVHGLGPTSKARKGVVDAGIESETVQRYLVRNGARRPEDTRPLLFILDESSLVATRQMNEFFRTVQTNDRVLVMGDRKQHQSIEAGRAFEQLQDAGMRVITLQKIVRQMDESLRKTVEMLRAGRVREAVRELESAGRLKQVQHRGHRLEAIAKNYVADPDGALVISPDNNSRRKLNSIIRQKMREAGKLGEDAAEITILISRQDVTGADRALAASYRVGDAIRYLKGSEVLGIEAKSYGVVKAVDVEKNEVTIGFRDGREVAYDPTRLVGVTLYEQENRKFAIGDRIQWTAPWRNKGISTRDTATICEIDAAGNIRARLDEGGRIVSWNARSNRHIDHAYAMTSYAAQGATVDRVLVHIDTSDSRNQALINQTLGYVAISRPRYDAQIYTDSKEQIAYALSRLRMNTTALAPEQTAEYKERAEKMAIGV